MFHKEPYLYPRTLNYKASCFPAYVDFWKNNDIITLITRTYDTSKLHTSILGKIKPKRKETYDALPSHGFRYLTQQTLGLNPLIYYKFNHNFRDTHDSMCKLNGGIEDAEHFLFNCHQFTHIRNTLMSNVSEKINADFSSFNPIFSFKPLFI